MPKRGLPTVASKGSLGRPFNRAALSRQAREVRPQDERCESILPLAAKLSWQTPNTVWYFLG